MNSAPPEGFVYHPDMAADEIPAVSVSPRDLGVKESVRRAEFVRVPSAIYQLFTPADRLLLCLIFAREVFGEDAPGGWIRLRRELTNRFGLDDRSVRMRAVAALERQGVAEVRRRNGAASLLRLIPKQIGDEE